MNEIKDLLNGTTHRWITDKVVSYNSGAHGLGISVIEKIKKGEDILVYGGIIIHKSQINAYWDEMGHVGTQIDDDFFIVPRNREELSLTGTINHSCTPNVGFKNQIQLFAIRDIEKGEELFLDYAFCESMYPKEFDCKCGSESCRGKVSKNDWMLKDVQEKYREYFSPYLQKKI